MKKQLKKYFIPHEGNDHKPHFLREKSVMGMATLLVVLLAASILGSYLVKHNRYLASIQSAFLVDLANEDRLDEGQATLLLSDKLTLAAQLKANDMATKGYFAHTSPEGLTPWHWFRQSGYDYIFAGENLAVNFSRSEDVQRAWMQSPLHRANILNGRYKEIGIATAEGTYKGRNTVFVVQMFGTPAGGVSTAFGGGEQQALALEAFSGPKSSTNGQEMMFAETVHPDYADAVVAGASDEGEIAGPYTTSFERFLVNPADAVNKAYGVLFALILFSVIVKIFVAIRKQHPKNIAYGIILLVMILIFMHINREMFSMPLIALAS